MTEALQWAQGLTPVLQVILIVVLCVIFWEPIAQKVFGYEPKKIESEPERSSRDWFVGIEEQISEVVRISGQLAEHYNHETTGLLTEMRDLLTKLNSGLEKLHQQNSEWEKFGIPTRECKMEKSSL